MSITSPEHFTRPQEFAEGTVWVDRVASRQLVGYNQRGVEIPIGMEEGRISPGELLKLALAGCAGMSLDHSAARRLGENFAMRIFAHGLADPEEDRYFEIIEQIQLEIESLTPQERRVLTSVIDRAIDAACTIQRTLKPGAEVSHTYLASDGTSATVAEDRS